MFLYMPRFETQPYADIRRCRRRGTFGPAGED